MGGSTCCPRVPDVHLNGLLFWSGEFIEVASGKRCSRKGINGAVIGPMWWKGDRLSFIERLGQVMILIRYLGGGLLATLCGGGADWSHLELQNALQMEMEV